MTIDRSDPGNGIAHFVGSEGTKCIFGFILCFSPSGSGFGLSAFKAFRSGRSEAA